MTSVPIAADAVRKFCEALLCAYGVEREQASSVADNVLWSELVGRTNFGMLRLPTYLARVQAGALNPVCRPVFSALAPAAHLLDGDAGFGQYAGECAMDRAIALAAEHGTGIVGVRNSNFFGTGAYFVNRAASSGMIALALSNSFPKVAAHGGFRAALGTNPFAFGAPRRGGDNLMVDMATSGLAGSTVRQHIQSGDALPEGLAVAADGAPITDPEMVGEGALLPFGGAKGYGMALLVEILAGVLTGAGMSHGVASMYENMEQSGDNGHFMMAIDISRWMSMEAYHARFDAFEADVRGSGGKGTILLPGEIRWRNYHENLAAGINLADRLRSTLAELGGLHNVELPWSMT
jgi:LDH2 family malate/lactate/ureidoglycolate dehydrogenase